MIVGLCWIIGSYGLCVLIVHLLYAMNPIQAGNMTPVHYMVLTKNNQVNIEWYLRYLWFFSWLKGKHIKVTVIDNGSSDETLEIIDHFSGPLNIVVIQQSESPDWDISDQLDRYTVVLNLRNKPELVEVPLF